MFLLPESLIRLKLKNLDVISSNQVTCVSLEIYSN